MCVCSQLLFALGVFVVIVRILFQVRHGHTHTHTYIRTQHNTVYTCASGACTNTNRKRLALMSVQTGQHASHEYGPRAWLHHHRLQIACNEALSALFNLTAADQVCLNLKAVGKHISHVRHCTSHTYDTVHSHSTPQTCTYIVRLRSPA